jgi:hypothetical protein
MINVFRYKKPQIKQSVSDWKYLKPDGFLRFFKSFILVMYGTPYFLIHFLITNGDSNKMVQHYKILINSTNSAYHNKTDYVISKEYYIVLFKLRYAHIPAIKN